MVLFIKTSEFWEAREMVGPADRIFRATPVTGAANVGAYTPAEKSGKTQPTDSVSVSSYKNTELQLESPSKEAIPVFQAQSNLVSPSKETNFVATSWAAGPNSSNSMLHLLMD